MDLLKQTVANIKKASVLADKWLVQNGEPSGTIWEDLCAFLIANTDEINKKEKVFTGMAAFICYSKYNESGENILNCLSKNDQDAVATTDASRAKSRKTTKKQKDKQCSIESGSSSLLNGCGYTIDTCMQIVEIAQFEEAQARGDQKYNQDHLINRHKLLLYEREQKQIWPR